MSFSSIALFSLFTLFLHVILATPEFLRIPVSRTWILGLSTTFQCQHSTAQHVAWRVNGASLGDIRDNDFRTSSFQQNGRQVIELTVDNLTFSDNNTEIVCVALDSDGMQQGASPAATLLLQGWI